MEVTSVMVVMTVMVVMVMVVMVMMVVMTVRVMSPDMVLGTPDLSSEGRSPGSPV